MGIPRALRVRARQGITTRFDLLDQGVRRMVGRKLVPHPDALNGHAWVDTGEIEEVPYMAEFVEAIRNGSLWAADEATAMFVFGTEWRKYFDASFGTTPIMTTSAAAKPAEESV